MRRSCTQKRSLSIRTIRRRSSRIDGRCDGFEVFAVGLIKDPEALFDVVPFLHVVVPEPLLAFENGRVVVVVVVEAIYVAFPVLQFPLLLVALGRHNCAFPDNVFPFVNLFEGWLDFGVFGFGSGMRKKLWTRRT